MERLYKTKKRLYNTKVMDKPYLNSGRELKIYPGVLT
jgi:hypothetical protein